MKREAVWKGHDALFTTMIELPLANGAAAVGALLEPWQWAAILRMLLCLVIGGAVGLEREFHGRAAGFRTHILVCLGCCIVMLVSVHFERLYGHLGSDSAIRVDPARMAYGVVTGIGFLGAGVIMKHGVTVHGLTTAASLWSVAALGLSVGVGMYVVAAAGTLLALVTLMGMRHLGNWIPSHHYRTVRVTHADADLIDGFRRKLENAGAKVLSEALDHRRADGMTIATYQLRFTGERDISRVHDLIREVEEFDRIEIE